MQLSLTFQNAIFNPKIKITDNANKTCTSHIEAKEIILVKKNTPKRVLKQDLSTLGQFHTSFFAQEANDA